jgi:hypothetical protein
MGYCSNSFDADLLAEEERDDGTYLGRHWRGTLPLPQSYWVNGFLTNIGLAVIGFAFATLEEGGNSLRLIAFGFIAYVLIFLVARTWSVVGIWRSAGRHAARGGSPGWGTTARVLMVLGVGVTLVQLPGLGLQAREYALIAAGRDPLGPVASLAVDDGGKVMRLSGMLAAGTADRFEEIVAAAPGIETIVLESGGGRIFEALRMADVIRERGFDTRVDGFCSSACTFLLLAGEDRSAHRFAQIGFHQPDFPGLSEAQRSTYIEGNRKDYIAAGIEPEFLDRALSTPPEEMWYPTHSELVDAGVLTAEEITVGSSDRDRKMLHELLVRTAVETNLAQGQMIDDITRLEGAELNGSELRVRHRITRALGPAELARTRSNLEENLLDEMCNSPRRAQIETGASYGFDYDDPAGKQLISITIDKCPKAAG